VEAGASELVIFFDDGGFQAILAGSHGCGVAAGSAADDDQVISHFDFRIASAFLVSGFWFLVEARE
jgi:hypothetical protein